MSQTLHIAEQSRTLAGLAGTLQYSDLAIREILAGMREAEPCYPDSGRKGDIEYHANVTYLDPNGGGDHIDVTCYDSKDFGARIAHARSRGDSRATKRIIKNLEAYSNRIGFSVMDVEGKGPAALQTAIRVNDVMKANNNRDFEQYGEVTLHAIEHLNDHFYSEHERKVSFIYGEVTNLGRPRRDGIVALCRAVSAGGIPPLIYRASLKAFDPVSLAKGWWHSGMLLGTAPSDRLLDKGKRAKDTFFKEPYQVNEFGLRSGDVVVFPTDGHIDYGAAKARKYPIERAEEVIRKNIDGKLSDIESALFYDRKSYEPVPINDDLGMLLIRHRSVA